MGAGTYNFEIEQGSTFSRTITFKQSDGTAMDLTGYGIRGQMRVYLDSPTIIFTFTFTITSPYTLGIVGWSMTSVETAAIPSKQYVYDVELYQVGSPEVVDRCMEGVITVSGEVTR